jgi:hypothetical protein
MKSFKDYLTESKKVYEFKVKIAGECPKDAAAQIKAALEVFHVGTVSAPRRTPIQENHADFPEHKNIHMTIFDVTTNYPAISPQIRDLVASGLGITLSSVKVKNMKEEEEYIINHANDNLPGEAIIGTDYEPSDNSSLFGEKYNLSFLKELGGEPKKLKQYTGINDNMLAKSAPAHSKETPGKDVKIKTKATNIFTKQIKVPTAKGATK